MRVEARRDEDEVGLERAHGGLDDRLERRPVLGVARARGERDVDDAVRARTGPARAGPERPLVQRDGEDRRVVREERFGPVPVVHVEVDDRDAREAQLGLRVASRDRDVVEDAEAHRFRAKRVVPGRADEREAASPDRLDRAPGGEPRRLPRRRAGERVGIEPGVVDDRVDGRRHTPPSWTRSICRSLAASPCT